MFKIPEDVKFGVDQSGNPVELAQFFEEKKKLNDNKRKIIAYIIQKDENNNFLVDIKGNILQKTDDDYYCYKEGNEFIIIKDFDIQHPELRVFGHRKMNYEELTETIEIKSKDQKDKIYTNPLIIKTEGYNENKNVLNDNNEETTTKHMYLKTNLSGNNDYFLNNNNIDDILLSYNSKSNSVAMKENNRLNEIKQIDIFHRKEKIENNNKNNEFIEQMN